MDEDFHNILVRAVGENVRTGHRIRLLADGRGDVAGVDDEDIGVAMSNSGGGMMIVRLHCPPMQARIAGPVAAGQRLVKGAAGTFRAAPPGSTAEAIALSPVGDGQATIAVMPTAVARGASAAPAVAMTTGRPSGRAFSDPVLFRVGGEVAWPMVLRFAGGQKPARLF